MARVFFLWWRSRHAACCMQVAVTQSQSHTVYCFSDEKKKTYNFLQPERINHVRCRRIASMRCFRPQYTVEGTRVPKKIIAICDSWNHFWIARTAHTRHITKHYVIYCIKLWIHKCIRESSICVFVACVFLYFSMVTLVDCCCYSCSQKKIVKKQFGAQMVKTTDLKVHVTTWGRQKKLFVFFFSSLCLHS